jgi:hypothetical protein
MAHAQPLQPPPCHKTKTHPNKKANENAQVSRPSKKASRLWAQLVPKGRYFFFEVSRQERSYIL